MTAHTKGRRGTGPQDRDRRSRRDKLDRERSNTDARNVLDGDLRGKGREGIEQQRRSDEQARDVIRRRRPSLGRRSTDRR